MNNKDILEIAMKQTAIDSNCTVEDLKSSENKVVISKDIEGARRYLKLPFFCDLASYGSNVVASVDERIVDFIQDYINRYQIEQCFVTPNIHLLIKEFEKYGKTVCFMAEYFLPDIDSLKPLPCEYEIKILNPEGFSQLYLEEWSNSLSKARPNLDKLVAAAYDEDKIIGMAGCSADCDTMWQIGVDVLPEYRKKGVASALTSRLAIEILERGKVPFYCCAWSNIRSARNAIRSGFRPAWVQLTAKGIEETMAMTK